MEQNKFEQDIRQKMEQRTIQPTEMAWDRLDAMLSVAEGKKKKPNRTWMYMAASFLALLLVGTLFLNREKETGTNTTNTNSVVTTEKQPEVHKEVSPNNVSVKISNEQEQTVATAEPVKTEAKVNGITKTPKYVVKHGVKTPVNTAVATTNTTAPVTNTTQGVAATANNPVVISPAVTPSKIKVDAASLLASVDRTSVNKPVSNPVVINPKVQQPSVKVNANSLLSSVEGELDDSFRTKVLNTVSKNYNKVKTSVATRNHQ